MTRHLTLLTGATRGLGAAIALQLLREPSNVVLGLSRGSNAALAAQAQASGATLEQWPTDLAAPLEAAARVEAWLGAQDAAAFDSATLINNAATLTRVGPLEASPATSCRARCASGSRRRCCSAPPSCARARGWRAERKLLNISSGLGRRAMAGQAAYCATRPAWTTASRAIALDEALKPHGARVVSLAPGVIDTDMQAQLRAADTSAFPEHGAVRAAQERR